MDFRKMSQAVRSVTVEWMDDECTVQYRPGANTAASAIGLSQAYEKDNTEGTLAMVENLTKVLVAWDVMDGDKPLPLTQEVLLECPSGFLLAIIAAINEDQSPKPKKSRR